MREFEVIIPVRNGGPALRNSIQSVLACANSSRILLTLSDNCSSDGSPWKDLLTKFPQEQWRIISPPQSLGRVEHWTWAFQQAQLPWVKPLMVGDCIENGFWDWVGAAIEQFPQAAIFFSKHYTIDPARAHQESNGNPSTAKSTTALYDYDQFTRDAIRGINEIGALSRALLRADVMRVSLPFEPEFPWTADQRFCGRCLQQAPAAQTDAALVCLDRSIVRLSTSWKGLRGSFREEWKFAAEQAALTRAPRIKSFFLRGKAVCAKMIFVVGKRVLPRSVRGFLTTATGLHRPSPKRS
jgi:hypothetical protein